MTSGLVLVNMSLGNGFIDNRYGSFVASLSLFLIACVNCSNDFLDEGTKGCALPSVKLAAFFGLTGAFFRLC